MWCFLVRQQHVSTVFIIALAYLNRNCSGSTLETEGCWRCAKARALKIVMIPQLYESVCLADDPWVSLMEDQQLAWNKENEWLSTMQSSSEHSSSFTVFIDEGNESYKVRNRFPSRQVATITNQWSPVRLSGHTIVSVFG